MSTITDILKVLKPPADNASSKHVTGWRWAIVIAICFLLIDGIGGRGYLPFIPAYAYAADVDFLLQLQLAAEIRNLYAQMCALPPAQRRSLENILEDYQIRYEKLTGNRYPSTACPA